MAKQEVWIARWQPARLNQWDGKHWAIRARAKKADAEVIGVAVRLAGVPEATGRRRVSLSVRFGLSKKGPTPDPDGFLKSTLDALVHSRRLIDDSGEWCEIGDIETRKTDQPGTLITLEDIEDAAAEIRHAGQTHSSEEA